MNATALAIRPVRRPRLLEWSALMPLLVIPLGVVLYVLCFTVYRTHLPVDGDGQGYYAYLPSYLLRHDPSFNYVLYLDILPHYAALGHQPPQAFGFSLQPNGAWLDKYGVGVAILESPFFVIGHLIALVTANAEADGYSAPELYTVGLAALFYLVLALFALRAVLRRWFSDGVVAVTLAAVTLGAGVIVYVSWGPSYSHAFAFFAVSIMLLCAVRWYEQPRSWVRALLLGLAMGLVVAVRLTNIELLVVVPLLGIGTLAAARTRLRLIRDNASRVALVVASAGIPLVPQVVTWWYATGHLIARPYPGEYFSWGNPQLAQSLVSFRPHGLLPYYPVLALSFAGTAWAWFRRRDIALPVTVVFLGFWYMTASWWIWWFSAAFGDRAFVDVVPILAVPLAFFFTSLRPRRLRVAGYALAALLVAVTCMLIIAYFQRRIPEEGIGPGGYAQILLHPSRLLDAPIKPAWLR